MVVFVYLRPSAAAAAIAAAALPSATCQSAAAIGVSAEPASARVRAYLTLTRSSFRLSGL